MLARSDTKQKLLGHGLQRFPCEHKCEVRVTYD
jgi:hypothetical protein